MTLQLQNTAHWLDQMLQQRGLNTPLSLPLVAEGFSVNEPQPTLNHQAPQQSSKRTNYGDGEVNRRNEHMARARGQVVRELIENNETESYSSEPAERSES